ncbi:glycerophosphodiester phosphodiesterase family protein [Novosphingobium sp. KCTC 2891]|uniref:glycerophosphodiester phosphodiesterase family protein n=1 Tax=Novosphingobium sp. KCTC 2891 TaxID=2989730 RepID=UPI0022230417|nr:glycerophosphodiester phosphodiesterase family protein [Novosphingobium sp. KCTC 2891]MCW1383193.1 glycerophosphodiester phosphodiesterase family protein [Novosphingobium sp. KCTC 2891]
MLSLLFILLDRWLAPAPAADRVGWLTRTTYAHRGLHGGGAPENAPSAFALAVERGLGIECDVQRTSDGQAVVFHDWELDRLTGASGPVIDRSAAQLQTLALAGGSEGDTIPGLRRVLELVAGRVPLLIEIKSKRQMHVVPLCLAVRRMLEGYRGPVAVMSFDPRVSRWFDRHSSHVVRGLVMTEDGRSTLLARVRRHLALWHARPDFLAYDVRDLPSRFAAAQRRRGLPLLTWTVRSPELAERAHDHADAAIAEGAGLAPSIAFSPSFARSSPSPSQSQGQPEPA